DAAIASAPIVLEETFASQRYVPSPMETRGIVAAIDPYTDRINVWSNTQTPHRVRDHIAHSLGMSSDDITVTAPDVGGGFGQKGVLIVEEILIPYAARALGRTVRWQADRSENLTADTHAREQIHHLTIAADEAHDVAAAHVGDAPVTDCEQSPVLVGGDRQVVDLLNLDLEV